MDIITISTTLLGNIVLYVGGSAVVYYGLKTVLYDIIGSKIVKH